MKAIVLLPVCRGVGWELSDPLQKDLHVNFTSGISNHVALPMIRFSKFPPLTLPLAEQKPGIKWRSFTIVKLSEKVNEVMEGVRGGNLMIQGCRDRPL